MSKVSLASMMAVAALATQPARGTTSPSPPTTPPTPSMPPAMTTDFVRVTAPWISIPIESSPMTCEVGKHVMLIQENEEFFITMCSNQYEGAFLAAFPTYTRDGRPAWVTPDRKVFFAYRTSSCRGRLYFRQGDELPIESESHRGYNVRLERFDQSFPVFLPKTNSGIEFVKAPAPTPAQITAAITAQKAAVATAQKAAATAAQKSAPPPPPRPPPVNRYIVTPVGPSTNLFVTSLPPPKPAASAQTDKPADKGFLSGLFGHGEKAGQVADKSKPPAVAKSEPAAKAETPAPASVATTVASAAASSATGVKPAAVKETPQPAGTSLLAQFTAYQTPIIIGVALLLFIVGFLWELKRKAKRRELAMETTAKAMETAAVDAEKPPPVPSSSTDFSGSIASMSLGSVTQFLNSDKETGTLHVKDKGNAELGVLVFIKGEIIDARSGNKRGIDALYDILKTKEGFFSFLREEPKNVEKTITQGTISLLLDAHRIMDEEHKPPPVPPAPTPPPLSPAAKVTRPAATKPAPRLKLHGNR